MPEHQQHLVTTPKNLLLSRPMRRKDTPDAIISAISVIADACAVFAGLALATKIRFESGLIPIIKGIPANLWQTYLTGAAVATILFLFIFRALGLYVRPQTGSFPSKIPRLIRGSAIGVFFTAALGFIVKTEPPFSAAVVIISLLTIPFIVILERYILFRIEWNVARHSSATNNVLVLGTDTIAAHVARTLKKEPMLRSKVTGFLRTDISTPDKDIPADMIKGTVDELSSFLSNNKIDQIILTNSYLGHDRIVEIILTCEHNLITFNMVPDLFRIMTSSMDVQSLDDIPLLGTSKWPLDLFWNRTLKRMEDILGSSIGLFLSAPVIALSALAIKINSPGPVFYRQTRCGEKGKEFTLYKLRTMRVDAEAKTGPVFTSENDPRTTKTGAWLRKHNIDELPQLWNVLKGDMSLIGPRPERPHFVEQFKEDVSRYMWRHVSKPGMSGWAQVNGLRGNTSIKERVRYDLYYLENWSLAFDFKIFIKTLFAKENAY